MPRTYRTQRPTLSSATQRLRTWGVLRYMNEDMAADELLDLTKERVEALVSELHASVRADAAEQAAAAAAATEKTVRAGSKSGKQQEALPSNLPTLPEATAASAAASTLAAAAKAGAKLASDELVRLAGRRVGGLESSSDDADGAASSPGSGAGAGAGAGSGAGAKARRRGSAKRGGKGAEAVEGDKTAQLAQFAKDIASIEQLITRTKESIRANETDLEGYKQQQRRIREQVKVEDMRRNDESGPNRIGGGKRPPPRTGDSPRPALKRARQRE